MRVALFLLACCAERPAALAASAAPRRVLVTGAGGACSSRSPTASPPSGSCARPRAARRCRPPRRSSSRASPTPTGETSPEGRPVFGFPNGQPEAVDWLGKNADGTGGDILLWKRKAEAYLIESGVRYTIGH